jgi:hypothetical protein
MLCDDAPVFHDNGDGGGCNYNDHDSACNAHGHDGNHACGAWVVSADGAHHDVVATDAGAAG